MVKEQWKYIKGFNHKYMISNKGNVYVNSYVAKCLNYNHVTYRHIKGHMLTKSKTTDGYLFVTLIKKRKYYHYRIHRLVANAFIPNPHHYPVVNHKDENICNNNVFNLEWCTQKYNCNYGNRTLRSFLTNSYYATEHLNTHLLSKHDIKIFHKIHRILRQLHCINVK